MRQNIKRIIIGMILSTIAIPSFSEETAIKLKDESKIDKTIKKIESDYKGLGISAGAISGVGFSYRQYFYETYGFKASTAGYIDDNQSFFNFGIQGLKELSSNDWLRFYVLAGISNFSFNNTNYIYPEQTKPSQPTPNTTTSTEPTKLVVVQDPIKTKVFSNYMNFGAGIGLEIGRKEQGLSLALELPLVVSIKDFNKLNFIYPIPQISLVYNF